MQASSFLRICNRVCVRLNSLSYLGLRHLVSLRNDTIETARVLANPAPLHLVLIG